MSTPSLTSHNSNSSSSFSSSSSSSSSSSTPITTTELSTINLIPDKKLNPTKTIIESLTKTKSKTSLDHIINETIPTNNDSLILLTKTSEIVQKTIKSKEFEKNKTDNNYQQHQRQQQQQINDFVDETFRKNLLNFNNNNNNNNNDLKLLSTNKINNKKRRNNCNNLFDITDNKNENIKNDTIVSNDIIINNIQCLQSNINDDIDQNLDEIYPPIKSIKILPTLNQNNDINNIIDQQNLLEINIDKKFIINNNNIDNNKNIQDISPLYNSPNSNSCNNNNNNSSTTSNTNVSNSSNNSTSSGGSILAQTNTSSATTTLSPFYGCNSTNIITSNNNNNLLTINGKQQKQLSVNVSSLFNINDHKEENKINVNFNLNNNNSSIRNIIHNKINNDTITEQMNIKEESTGNLLESGKAQIKIEDEPPPSQSPVCHTSIMSDINIKKESKNISSPSSSSSSSTGNNGNGTGTNVSGNSSEVPNNNNTNIIGSTNTGSILHSSSSGGCGGSSSGVGINNNSISSTDNKKSDGSTDDMLSKDDMLADNNTEMNTTIKKEESATDLSTDGFSPLCTSHNVGGSSNNGNNVNMQPILNSGGGQVVSSGNSIVNPTSSSSIGSNNNNNSTCGLSSNNRGGNRMGISPPECGIQSLSSSNSINVSGSGPGNGNNIGGGGGGNNNGGNNGNGGNNNNKQSMGNNGGLGAVDYMQQQNHIFVFSTQLANKGAESVLTGQYPTMIAYHCAQPTTKKFLEDFFLKNPMKLSKMNRQNSVNSQWIQQQNLNNNNSHKLIQNKQNNNNNISSINSNNNNNNNSNRTSSIKSSISTSSSTIPSNLQTNSTNNFVNDELSGNDASDILSWEHNANHLGLDTLPNGSNLDNMDDNSGIVSRESPTDNVTGSTGNNNNNNRNQMQSSTSIQQQSPTMLTSNTLTGGPTSPSLSCLQPSLQGVKVPDENLTPQQRQHREEQLAKLKKMNQFLFPEHTSGMGPDFISGSGIPTDNTTDQNLIGTNNIVGNVITPSNSKLISSGGPSGLVNQSVNNSSNVPVGMISGNSGGGSGSVSSVIGPNNNSSVSGVSAGPNNIPIIPNLSSGNGNISIFPLGGPQNNRGGGVNNNNNNMMSVSSGSGLGSRNIGPICRQIGSLNNMSDNMMGNNLNDFGIMMGSGNHNSQQNQQSIMNSIISGGGPMSSQLGSMGPGSINQCGPLGGSSGMMIGSGQKNIGGIAQMEWNKLQHQYYEERTKGGKGSIDGIPIGELCNSSQNISGVIGPNGRQIISSGNNNNGPPLSSSGPIRQNSQNCQRSQGPPPPYHQTPRSASVPIATQSPNPGSPNNPTSNLSLPSPRTAGSTLNSPAGDVTTTTNSGTGGQQQGNKSQQLQYKQDSPPGGGNTCNNSNGNSGTNNNRTALSHSSNPNTPISSHMSPNASLKDLELGNTSLANSNQVDKNRMNTSGPSPQGPRTPSMIGEHSNPSSIDSRFPPASPNINFSPVTGQNNQNQSGGGGGNVQQQQQQIGPGSNNNQQKLQNFMDGGSGSGKCSASVNETTTSNFSLRADNLPLNPHTNCPPPAKPSHFDPISSLAQMSQQLTNSVSNSVNGGHGSNPGMMGGFPNHGGMGMSPGDMSIGPHGPVPDNLMGSGGGMDPCSMAAMGLGGMGGGNIGGPPGVLQGGPGGQYVMHGVPQNNMSAFGPMSGIPPRSLSPKLGGVGTGGIMSFPGNGPPIGMQAHRMMGRPMIGPGSGNPYNGANIQVKASTPNTIQYLPARPQIGNNNPRAPPSLEFLQRFANPIPGMDNCQPNKMSGGGGGIGPSGGGGGGQNMPSFYTNCNQIGPNGMSGGGSMNHPHGLDNSGLGGPDGNNSMMNMNMIGPGINPGNSMCGPMGQNIMMRGLRPPGQGGGGGMLRMPVGQNMSGSPGIGHHHHHHHHHSFSNGPQNNTQQNDSSMFSNQMFGGGPGGPKVNPLNMLGGPNSGGGGVGSQMPGSGSSIMQSETGQSLPSSLSGPGQSGGPNNGSGNSGVGSGGPGSGGPNNFKSQFVGPSTADPNYAQQYHNFQQQLYATSTRSQPSGPGGNNGIPGGPTSSNQSFFVPK